MSDTEAIEVASTVTGEIRPVLASRMTPAQASEWRAWVDEMKRSVLRQGVDYDIIPGTGKTPSLLKPGAEILLMAGGFGFTNLPVEDEWSRRHEGVTYRCTVHRGHTDNVVATCDGYAGYEEARFYVSAQDNERKERMYAERDQRAVKPERFVEYRQSWNGMIKMAEKRALVGAALNATCSSGLFTQDLEDTVPDQRTVWDPGVVRSWIDGLSGDGKVALRAWWLEDAKLPPVDELNPAQAAQVLVEVGKLVAVVALTPPSETAPPEEPQEAVAKTAEDVERELRDQVGDKLPPRPEPTEEEVLRSRLAVEVASMSAPDVEKAIRELLTDPDEPLPNTGQQKRALLIELRLKAEQVRQ